MAAVLAAFWAFSTPARAGSGAQAASCGDAWVAVEGGEPSPYVLARNSTETLRIDPDSVLKIRFGSLPAGSEAELRMSALGFELTRDLGPVSAGAIDLNVKDYSTHLRGKYAVEIRAANNGEVTCVDQFTVDIHGFGGTLALAFTALTIIAGLASLASISVVARGGLDVHVGTQTERRRRGWRRIIPVLRIKRIVIAALLGAITGFCGMYVVQGIGATLVTLPKALLGAIAGGSVSLGFGVSIGAAITYLRPVVGDAPKKPQSS